MLISKGEATPNSRDIKAFSSKVDEEILGCQVLGRTFWGTLPQYMWNQGSVNYLEVFSRGSCFFLSSLLPQVPLWGFASQSPMEFLVE